MEPTKYKFIETTGCTAFNFTVNDKQFSEVSEQEYSEMLSYLFVKVKEGINRQAILLEDVVKLFQPDDYEHDPDICEQCGDSITTISWNI